MTDKQQKTLALRMMGMKIRSWRNAQAMTQEQLAEVTSLSPRLIRYYEAGQRQVPTAALCYIANALETRISDLLP